MKRILWNGLAAAAGMVTAAAARKATASLWPGAGQPPLNPADRRIGWTSALGWAVASGVGAGVARLVSRRAAAAGWGKVFDETPPGIGAGPSTASS